MRPSFSFHFPIVCSIADWLPVLRSQNVLASPSSDWLSRARPLFVSYLPIFVHTWDLNKRTIRRLYRRGQGSLAAVTEAESYLQFHSRLFMVDDFAVITHHSDLIQVEETRSLRDYKNDHD